MRAVLVLGSDILGCEASAAGCTPTHGAASHCNIYICMHICIMYECVCIDPCRHSGRAHRALRTYTYAYAYACAHAYVYMCMYTYVYMPMCTCTCVCMCTCAHVYIYSYIYMGICKYMHIHINMYTYVYTVHPPPPSACWLCCPPSMLPHTRHSTGLPGPPNSNIIIN